MKLPKLPEDVVFSDPPFRVKIRLRDCLVAAQSSPGRWVELPTSCIGSLGTLRIIAEVFKIPLEASGTGGVPRVRMRDS